MSNDRDRWAAGSAYEDFMGRWSRRLAPLFVAWLRIPRGAHWLDVGCGTGALTRAICGDADPASVVGCDPSEPFIEFARGRVADSKANFRVAKASALPRRDGGYDSIASLLALNFFPDTAAALREMRSAAAAGGTVSACVWDYGQGMEMLRYFWDSAAALDAAARGLHEGARFPLCRPAALEAAFGAAELRDVRCEPLEIPTIFSGFEDYWRPLLGGTGPVPTYVASLDAERRAALAERLERALPRGTRGEIALTARAWAVRGIAG